MYMSLKSLIEVDFLSLFLSFFKMPSAGSARMLVNAATKQKMSPHTLCD
jgi:hypothetical protein